MLLVPPELELELELDEVVVDVAPSKVLALEVVACREPPSLCGQQQGVAREGAEHAHSLVLEDGHVPR